MKPIFCAALLTAAALPAGAHTVLLNEDFSNDWTANFSSLELDGNAPLAAFNAIFMDGNGVAQPWWPVRDSSTSQNRYIASHSAYQKPASSNYWLVSKPLEIPTEDFILTFEAQSLLIRQDSSHALSDLHVFVTEKPVTADWQPDPSEAVKVCAECPLGENPGLCDFEFTTYSVNLDAYAGKTVYISFANLNNDRDILALDNVLVQRLDPGDMTVTAPAYIEQGDFNVDVEITGTLDEGLDNWTVTFTAGETVLTESGARLDNGEKKSMTFTAKVGGDQQLPYTVVLSSENAQNIEYRGSIHGLLFTPEHRVLLEEATGTWCGNCPLGIYTVECMEEDPEMHDKVIPVSIHANGSPNDPMVVEDYIYQFGTNSAPVFRMERGTRVLYLGNNDYTFDKNKPSTLGYTVAERTKEITLADIAISGTYNADKTKINATVEMTPAITLDGSRYKIGIILTENNVHLNGSPLWFQHNYMTGTKAEGNLNGWTLLPASVPNVRYQDVARAIFGYKGLPESTPDAPMAPGQKHTVTVELEVPNTYKAGKNDQGELVVTSPAINPDNVCLTAFLIDAKEDTGVVNAARCAMSENAEPKFTTRDLCLSLGIDPDAGVSGIESDSDAPAEYFNMQGVKVANPEPGMYIVRRGSKVTKEIIR